MFYETKNEKFPYQIWTRISTTKILFKFSKIIIFLSPGGQKFEFYIDHGLPHLGSIFRSQHRFYSVKSTYNHVVNTKNLLFQIDPWFGKVCESIVIKWHFPKIEQKSEAFWKFGDSIVT